MVGGIFCVEGYNCDWVLVTDERVEASERAGRGEGGGQRGVGSAHMRPEAAASDFSVASQGEETIPLLAPLSYK